MYNKIYKIYKIILCKKIRAPGLCICMLLSIIVNLLTIA
jgi:hypothetical protein